MPTALGINTNSLLIKENVNLADHFVKQGLEQIYVDDDFWWFAMLCETLCFFVLLCVINHIDFRKFA